MIAGNVVVLILWVMSRSTGLPTGGELSVREPFGLLDGFAAAAEFLVVVAGLTTTVRHAKLTDRRSGGRRLAFGLALTWMVAGGAGLAFAGGEHHHGGGSSIGVGCPAAHDCADHSH